ncbi:Uncharacterised protein [Mycobacteroides abscessus subsp. abscessus]|nr:Uncharacterised protein [Mycobacteroides abscessus subsp. abscessus]
MSGMPQSRVTLALVALAVLVIVAWLLSRTVEVIASLPGASSVKTASKSSARLPAMLSGYQPRHELALIAVGPVADVACCR